MHIQSGMMLYTQIIERKDQLHDAFFKHDYNIDELASMLLDDTVIERVVAHPSNAVAGDQLPRHQLSPSGSSAIRGLTWFENSSQDTLSTMKSIKVSHLRPRPQGSNDNKDTESVSAPPIPRKSSKRVARQRRTNSESMNENEKLTNQKVLDQEAKSLPETPGDGSSSPTCTAPQAQGSDAIDKKPRGLRKPVRGAINDPNTSGEIRPAMKNRSISSMTIRENEVANLNNPKILSHIGFDVGYNTISDHARLAKPYRLSGTGSFRNSAYTVASGREARYPGSSNISIRSVSESVPRLAYDSYEHFDGGPEPILEDSQLGYEVHPGELVSSSPIAQSTPRVRSVQNHESPTMLPELGEGEHVEVYRTDGRLFDISNSRGIDVIKRKNSQVREVGSTMKAHLAKRFRKHLSPRQSNPFPRKPGRDSGIHQDAKSAGKSHFITSLEGIKRNTILTPKDPNAKLLQPTKHCGTEYGGNRASMRSEYIAPSEALSWKSKRARVPKPLRVSNKGTLSMLIAQSEPQVQQSQTARDHDSDSLMDTDELQWDDPMYNIGMRRI
ncbi:hypothetical protein F5884DRAFT_72364 [Xylogone sp. PMI_703]|nr:hypothetical protein F5884DRAFT_72364 [Xylogone sp. PMI_703]